VTDILIITGSSSASRCVLDVLELFLRDLANRGTVRNSIVARGSIHRGSVMTRKLVKVNIIVPRRSFLLFWCILSRMLRKFCSLPDFIHVVRF